MEKLTALKEKRDFVLSRLNARIAEEERKEASRQRKEETREKIVVGACLLADMEDHPEVREAVLQSLRRGTLLFSRRKAGGCDGGIHSDFHRPGNCQHRCEGAAGTN